MFGGLTRLKVRSPLNAPPGQHAAPSIIRAKEKNSSVIVSCCFAVSAIAKDTPPPPPATLLVVHNSATAIIITLLFWVLVVCLLALGCLLWVEYLVLITGFLKAHLPSLTGNRPNCTYYYTTLLLLRWFTN